MTEVRNKPFNSLFEILILVDLLIGLAIGVEAFNSLFEIHGTWKAVGSSPITPGLSILFLGFPPHTWQQWRYRFGPPFNSLFEILMLQTKPASSRRYTFNSLFEIHAGYCNVRIVFAWLSILFLRFGEAWEDNEGPLRPFQFSFWDSCQPKAIPQKFLCHSAFNSLFEIPRAPRDIEAKDHAQPFNSLFEIHSWMFWPHC